jgi:hypothetical protein
MPSYHNSQVDRLRKSKLALCRCSTGVLAAVLAIMVIMIVMLLTTVGVTQYEKQYDRHRLQLDEMAFRHEWCQECELVRDYYVCTKCEPAMRFSEQQQSLIELTRQQTQISIHNAVGFLWNWAGGITWPTMILSSWVNMLLSVSNRVALFNMGCTCAWLLYLVIRWLMVSQVATLQTALNVAARSAPVGFHAPSVDQLLQQQALDVGPYGAIEEFPSTYGTVQKRVRFQV